MNFADIALNTKSSNRGDLFTYSIPPELEGDILVGQMVVVSFANRKMNGIVIEIHQRKPDFETKNIEKLIDPVPLINGNQIELAKFISEYYWCGLGQVIFSMLPSNLRKRKTRLYKNEQEIKRKLKGNSKEIEDNFSLISKSAKRYLFSPKISDLTLTSYQKNCLEKIYNAIIAGDSKTFLLHGVTNSGKTEVYLRSFAKALENGGGGIYIVPEISLTPQAVERFEKVFGKERVAVIHSKLALSERLRSWIDIRSGKKDIVVGSRSAIFAPVFNLKLIIVDEEHDIISFKSDQSPRYELHKVAEKMAEIANSVLVFGSATPLITSYQKVLSDKWEYLSLPERVDGAPLPRIKIIDMEKERMSGNYSLFSESMVEALKMVLRNKKQSLLFLNRRGTASFIICETCKKTSMCDSCDSALVYHVFDNKLWCHHCSRKYAVPTRCSVCGGLSFRYLGRGTEKIESEINKIFPEARIARMDRDTMTSDVEYQSIFNRFKKGEIDILIGTQMIVHGWDVPNVDFAGVIGIDESLLIPDYTSDEKVFELLTQLSGRTGRGDAKGLMILQTFYPEHPIFQLVEKNDFTGFVKEELKMREGFGYPPYSHLVKLNIANIKKEVVEKKADELIEKLRGSLGETKKKLKRGIDIQIIGPVSPMVEKKYGRYWRTIIIKLRLSIGKTGFDDYKIRDDILSLVPKEWVVDIDPLNIL